MTRDDGIDLISSKSFEKIRCPGCVYTILQYEEHRDVFLCYSCGFSQDARKPLKHESKMGLASDVEDPDSKPIVAMLGYANQRTRRKTKPNSKVDLEHDPSAVAFEDVELERSAPGMTVVDVQDSSHYEKYD